MEINTERVYKILGNFASMGEPQANWYRVQYYKEFRIVKQTNSVYISTNTHKDNRSKWSLYDRWSLLISPYNVDVVSTSDNISEDTIKEKLLKLTDEIEELESYVYYFNN